MAFIFDNPIGYAQFQLRGGWKNTLWVAGVYALALVAIIFLTVRMSTSSTASTLNGWVVGLLIIQSALLILFGTSRVSAAIRRDITQNMFESHQLMPVGGFNAVIGYLLGGGATALSLGLVTAVIGMGVASGAGMPLDDYLVANCVLYVMVCFLWLVAAFMAFVMKGGMSVFVILFIAVTTSGGVLISSVPALRVLVAPLLTSTLVSMRTSMTYIPWTVAIALLAQAFVAMVCFIGSARKYRRMQDSAIPPMLGLAVVAGWVGISCIGIAWPGEFRPNVYSNSFEILPMVIATILSTMVIGIIPLASGAWSSLGWDHRRWIGDTPSTRRPVPLFVIALLATLFIVPVCWVMPVEDSGSSTTTPTFLSTSAGVVRAPSNMWALPYTIDPAEAYAMRARAMPRTIATMVVMFAFFIGLGDLIRWIYLRVSSAKVIAGFWLVLTCVIPLIMGYSITGNAMDPAFQRLGQAVVTVSPIGAIIQIWDEGQPDFRTGLIAILLINAIPVLLYHLGIRRLKAVVAGAA